MPRASNPRRTPRPRRPGALGSALIGAALISTALLASPALGTFTVSPTPPTADATYTADNLIAPGATSLTCAWSGASTVALTWTGDTSTYAGYQAYRSTTGAGGSFSTIGTAVAYNAHTKSDTTASSPTNSNIYTYKVRSEKLAWYSADTNAVNSNACAGTAQTSVLAAPATVPKLNSPEAMAWDTAGNMYVMDTGNKCVRQVTPESAGVAGTISMYVGNCTAAAGSTGDTLDRISATTKLGTTASSIAIDSVGNIFIADTSNDRIRRITGDGKINTIAGTGVAGFTGDGVSPASSGRVSNPSGIVVGSDGSAYFSDRGNNRIRRLTCDSMPATPCAYNGAWTMNTVGSTSALSNPEQLAIDTSDTVYVTDRSHHKIVKMTGCPGSCSGSFTVVAGTGSTGFAGDGVAGGAVTSGQLASPQGVAVDSATGDVYIADTGNKRIRKVTFSSNTITTVAGISSAAYTGEGYATAVSELRAPAGVAFHNNAVYIADTSNNMIRRIAPATANSPALLVAVAGDALSAATGWAGDGGPATWQALVAPAGMTSDSNNNIFIADSGDNRIRVLLPTGELMTVAGTGLAGSIGDGGAATAAKLDTPHGVALDGTTLFIADTNNNVIRQVLTPLTGGNISSVAGTGAINSTGDGGPATAAKMSGPWDVAVDGSHVVYVADTGNCRIRKFTVSGNMSAVVGITAGTCTGNATLTPLASVGLNSPKGLAATSGGDLYIADTSNHVIRKLVFNATSVTDFAGTRGTSGNGGDGGLANAAAASLASPVGVWIDGSNVYVASSTVGLTRIRKVNSLSGGTISTAIGTDANGQAGDGGPATSATLTTPFDGVVGASPGNLYVSSGGTIRRVVGPVP